jgi:GT2 family glycosyltransferase
MSDVAAIVLDINGGAMLHACLDSLAAQTRPFAEVIVWDNSETNLGFAGGNNEAWKQTTTDFVALINNDVVLDPDWLETVMGAMDDDVAAVQTMLRAPDGTIDGAGIDVSDGTIRQVRDERLAVSGWRLGPPRDESRIANRESRFGPPPLTANRQSLIATWGVSATAALYRRAAVGERPFDPRFFAYYEDVELCARLHEGGWRTVVLPVVKATHRGSASAGVLGRDAQRLRTRNRYFVARMHRGVGRIPALLWEDAKLLVRGRSSLRGIAEGLLTRL